MVSPNIMLAPWWGIVAHWATCFWKALKRVAFCSLNLLIIMSSNMIFPTMWYMRGSLIRAFASGLNIKLLTEHHLEFLSLKGGCPGSSESIHVKMPHCWKSHATAQLLWRINCICIAVLNAEIPSLLIKRCRNADSFPRICWSHLVLYILLRWFSFVHNFVYYIAFSMCFLRAWNS